MSRECSAEVYSPSRDTWQSATPMEESRSNFGIASLEGRVRVMGGFNGTSAISQVEEYDPDLDRWFRATHLTKARSAFCACVLSGLPNMKDFCLESVPTRAMRWHNPVMLLGDGQIHAMRLGEEFDEEESVETEEEFLEDENESS